MTTTTAPDRTDPAAAALEAARALAPRIRDSAAEAERLRTMPPDLAARIEEAGLFAMWLPRALGGLELDPATIVRVVEELSRADGAAGWTTLIGTSSAFLAWLEPDVARELIGDRPLGASTCVVAPTGVAAPDGAGWRVSGRWGWNSGARHAAFAQVAAVALGADGAPRRAPDGSPEWRLAFLPAAEVQVLDTWDSPGLRGTGSHDVVLGGVGVPDERFVQPALGPARHDGPLYRFGMIANINVTMAGWPLGVARRALDEFAALARDKRRGGPQSPTLAEGPVVQLELSRAEGLVQSARSFVFDVVGGLWATATSGDPLSLDQRARLSLATQQAVRASVQAVDGVLRLAGATVATSDHPINRCFRDLHVIDGHVFVSPDFAARYARHALGVPQPPFLL